MLYCSLYEWYQQFYSIEPCYSNQLQPVVDNLVLFSSTGLELPVFVELRDRGVAEQVVDVDVDEVEPRTSCRRISRMVVGVLSGCLWTRRREVVEQPTGGVVGAHVQHCQQFDVVENEFYENSTSSFFLKLSSNLSSSNIMGINVFHSLYS